MRPVPLTLLYVPGDRPDRFDKAVRSGADVVVLDLEDAVLARNKERARGFAADFLRSPQPVPLQVRVNDPRGPWGTGDLKALAGPGLPGLSGLRIPKVESAAEIHELPALFPDGVRLELHPLIESARGLEAAYEIASAHPAVTSIGLGEADLRGELGVTDDSGLAWARGRLVVAARAAGLPRPMMSVYPELGDDAGLEASCRAGRMLGFLGRAAIHPVQLPVIVRSFLPAQEEAEAAAGLLDALESAEGEDRGVVVLADGRFADRAMVEAARQTLALAEAHGVRQ